ncbi:MAG TPA: SPOR domain-containing protein, partial [Thermoanaerobaculia bacterium]|nr:SPOR domain-containing protein [Thermoanaerobaculia bacterium]
IAEAPKTAPVRSAGDPPPVAFPLPNQTSRPATVTATTSTAATEDAAVVDQIDVQVQRGDVITRKQVSTDGKTFEEVPVGRGEAPTASALDEQRRNAQRREAAAPRRSNLFFVQAGAFSVEANARALHERLTAIGQRSSVDRGDGLYRVRIGPFTTRDAAVEARTALETRGMSAIIVSE